MTRTDTRPRTAPGAPNPPGGPGDRPETARPARTGGRISRRNGFWLALSLAVCLVSAFGASLVQSAGGAVTVKNLTIETGTGRALSAILLKPDAATASAKRPAIVLAHGWWNNKEMQDANYVELARRGYVVMSIDMYGHGNSDAMPLGQEAVAATGMYDAVKAVAALPYVDTTKIGVSGHSNGARAANYAVGLDNQAATPLIRSVYLVDNDPVYTDPTKTGGPYIDYYGNRDVGLQADQYDEFFFRQYDAQGQAITAPRQYLSTPNAQSFLHFGADPTGASPRSPYTVYTQTIGGRSAIREIVNPAQTHPWGPESKSEVTSLLTYFDRSLGTPNAIAPGSQIWQIKSFFNLLGLVALAVFLTTFAKALVGTRAFASLRAQAPVAIGGRDRRGLTWFWGALLVGALVSGISYWFIQANPTMAAVSFVPVPPFNPQGAVFFIGVWAAVNGVVAVIVMAVAWRLYGRRQGWSLRELGALPGWRSFGLQVLAGLITVAAAYGLVFLVGYLFDTDFRYWVVAVKPFRADQLFDALIYLPLFAIYFFANSVAVNSFNRFRLARTEWLNTTMLAVAASAAPIVLVLWQYTTFFVTGNLVPGFGGIDSIWLFPPILLLAVAPIISRKIFKVSNSPYIGGTVMAVMVTLMSVSNTLTYTS